MQLWMTISEKDEDEGTSEHCNDDLEWQPGVLCVCVCVCVCVFLSVCLSVWNHVDFRSQKPDLKEIVISIFSAQDKRSNHSLVYSFPHLFNYVSGELQCVQVMIPGNKEMNLIQSQLLNFHYLVNKWYMACVIQVLAE